MTKPIKIKTYRDKHFTAIVYEYRGHKYEVTYPNGWTVCCTPAWIQHRYEQEKIDKMIEGTDKKVLEGSTGDMKVDLDEIWEMMGW